MIRRKQAAVPVRRRGVTFLETAIVSALMAFLAVLLSSAWSGLVRPTADMTARCRVAQEANLAAAALTRDLAGSSSNSEGRLGNPAQLRFICRMQPGSSELWLC